MTTPSNRPSRIMPRLTVRLRLTLTYAALFATAALVLLVVSYAMVADSLKSLPVTPGQYLSIASGLPAPTQPLIRFQSLIEGVRDALTSRSLHRLELEYAVVFGATLAISVLAGWWISGRILRPIAQITRTARKVSGQTLSARIASDGPDDELRELADTFDGMLDRLEATFASQQRFIANASHELRTPLTVIRTEVDVTLSDPRVTAEQLQATRQVVRTAVERSERMIDGLLALARSDGGGPPITEPVALDRRAREYLEHASAEVAAHELVIDTTAMQPAVAVGDPDLLERIVDNLIDNAIRHNTTGGYVEIASDTHDGHAHLRVSNGGAVISDQELARLAEPFHRLRRTAARDGAGLGVSIIQAVTRLHNGTLTLTNPPTGGLTANVRLPTGELTAPNPRPVSRTRTPGGKRSIYSDPT